MLNNYGTIKKLKHNISHRLASRILEKTSCILVALPACTEFYSATRTATQSLLCLRSCIDVNSSCFSFLKEKLYPLFFLEKPETEKAKLETVSLAVSTSRPAQSQNR